MADATTALASAKVSVAEVAKHWKEKLAAYESRLDEARLQWRELVRGLENSIPTPTPQ